MNRSSLPRVAARRKRTANPYIEKPPRSTHKPHRIVIAGLCAYCGVRRAMSRDHVIPRSVLRTYNATAPLEAPSIPPEWLVEEPSCLDCNLLKGARRLVPPSWASQVNRLNQFFPGTPWRVWSGDKSEPAFREVHT